MQKEFFDKVKAQIEVIGSNLQEPDIAIPIYEDDNQKLVEALSAQKLEVKKKIIVSIYDLLSFRQGVEDELEWNFIEHGKDLTNRYGKILHDRLRKEILRITKEGALSKVYEQERFKGAGTEQVAADLMNNANSFYTQATVKKKRSEQLPMEPLYIYMHRDEFVYIYLGALLVMMKAIGAKCKELTQDPVTEDIEKEMEQANLFAFESINEMLIFVKYTGIYDSLAGKFTSATISKILGHLTGKKDNVIERSLGKMTWRTQQKGENREEYKKNNPYTKPAVSNVLDTFRRLDIESEELKDIQSKIKSSSRN